MLDTLQTVPECVNRVVTIELCVVLHLLSTRLTFCVDHHRDRLDEDFAVVEDVQEREVVLLDVRREELPVFLERLCTVHSEDTIRCFLVVSGSAREPLSTFPNCAKARWTRLPAEEVMDGRDPTDSVVVTFLEWHSGSSNDLLPDRVDLTEMFVC